MVSLWVVILYLIGLAIAWLIIYSAVYAAIKTSRPKPPAVPAPPAPPQPGGARGDWFFRPEGTTQEGEPPRT